MPFADRDHARVYQREYYRRNRERFRAYAEEYAEQRRQAEGRVLLACCGQWQAVTQTPHTCGTCGRQYLDNT